MDKFTKLIPIKFDVKDASLKEAERKIDSFAKNFKEGMSFDGLKDELEKAFESKAMIAQIDELINELEGLHGAEIDAFRSALEGYREQLNPVKDVTQLLEDQFNLHRQIKALEKSGGNKDTLDTLRQMSDEINNQISLMGTDGQIAIISQYRDIEDEILELEKLGTKEAREKIAYLKEQQAAMQEYHGDLQLKDDSSQKEDFKSAMKALKGSKIFGEFGKMTNNFQSILSGFKTGFIGGLAATGAVFIKSLKDTLEAGEEAAKELLSANRMSDSNTRETMFEWGTSRAGAYGINQAMDIMNITSQENFMTADPNEQKRFLEIQKKFANKYITMQESGMFDELLQSQIEMSEFEKELEIKQAEFYSDNLDSIMAIKEATLKIQEVFIKLFGWIAKIGNPQYTKSRTTSSTSDVLQNYSSTSNVKTTNVSIDNSFNNHGVSTQSTVESALHEMLNVVDAAIS